MVGDEHESRVVGPRRFFYRRPNVAHGAVELLERGNAGSRVVVVVRRVVELGVVVVEVIELGAFREFSDDIALSLTNGHPRRFEAERPLVDDYYRERTADLSRVTVPLLSAANWGGQGLHTRGNFEGFTRAASKQKWLEVHGGSHWAPFYTDYGVKLQKRFFDHFLKGADNAWKRQPRVQLQVRHVDRFVERHENEWPLARTRWTRYYLALAERALSTNPPGGKASLEYDALGDGLTFSTPPLKQPLELTGPAALKLFLSSSTSDADVFVILRVFDPRGREVVFQGALDPHTPIAQGWLRASHRRLDPDMTLPYRPYHTHDVLEPLTPGKPVELDIEIWPTCIVVPAGYRIALTIRGKDYEYDGPGATLSNMKNVMRGCGPFVHDDPIDRPEKVFRGKVTLHANVEQQPYLLLPVIPNE